MTLKLKVTLVGFSLDKLLEKLYQSLKGLKHSCRKQNSYYSKKSCIQKAY